MRRELSRRARTAAVATLACGALAAPATAAQAAPDNSPFTFAVIGDIPYGAAQIARFPAVVDQINADPTVGFVDHLGDIKNGSTTCDDAYFQMIRTQFDRFQDPLVYTVGDNEWTDCHRPNNGSYNPLERLQKIRQVFFDRPGHTLGQHSVGVSSEAGQGLPENVTYHRAGVSFAALHVVGSDNSLLPWTGNSAPTPEQAAEEQHRTQGVLDEIDATFDHAGGQRAVVLMMQADMFDPTVPVADRTEANYGAFRPIVQAIARRAAAFHGPVYLLNGDSHQYNVDHPVGSGSSWLGFYGVDTPADNLTRITVDGSTGVDDYLRMRVDPQSSAVLTWEKVPFTS
ncbi:MAG: metallophosphoesterase [Blastococcus sp.]